MWSAALIACFCIAAAAVLPLAGLGAVVLVSWLVVRPGNPAFRDHTKSMSTVPYPLYIIATKLMRWAGWFERLKPAPLRVAELSSMYIQSQVMFALVNLGVAEALQQGPKTAEQLAAAAGPQVKPTWVARVLKMAAELGLVKRTRRPRPSAALPAACECVVSTDIEASVSSTIGKDASPDSHKDTSSGSKGQGTAPELQQPFSTGYNSADTYSATAITAVLCRGHPNCMADFVKLFEDHYGPFGHLSEGILTGTMPFELWSGGLDFWQHIKRSPRHAATFDGAMRSCNHTGAKILIKTYPWARYDFVVDVGGGNGQFLAELLATYPRLRGVLVDQQKQVERGQQWWAQDYQQLLPRMEFVAGDMFDPASLPRPQPGQKTVYVLKQVLHDWSDADSRDILRSIRAVIPPETAATQAKLPSLLVLETGAFDTILPDILQHRLAADLTMLMSFGDGKERDEQQSRELLRAAGFHPGRLLPAKGLMTIMEATPA